MSEDILATQNLMEQPKSDVFGYWVESAPEQLNVGKSCSQRAAEALLERMRPTVAERVFDENHAEVRQTNGGRKDSAPDHEVDCAGGGNHTPPVASKEEFDELFAQNYSSLLAIARSVAPPDHCFRWRYMEDGTAQDMLHRVYVRLANRWWQVPPAPAFFGVVRTTLRRTFSSLYKVEKGREKLDPSRLATEPDRRETSDEQ